jgi:hypothetical protein
VNHSLSLTSGLGFGFDSGHGVGVGRGFAVNRLIVLNGQTMIKS